MEMDANVVLTATMNSDELRKIKESMLEIREFINNQPKDDMADMQEMYFPVESFLELMMCKIMK